MSNVRIFVTYDREHDEDLLELFVQQASKAASGFEVSGRSMAQSGTDLWNERLRRAIREADQVVVICGEHTGDSLRMSSELRMAQEEERPYFLLWGRREVMCTKPATAKPADSMYSWTPEILETQALALRRAARSHERLSEHTRAKG